MGGGASTAKQKNRPSSYEPSIDDVIDPLEQLKSMFVGEDGSLLADVLESVDGDAAAAVDALLVMRGESMGTSMPELMKPVQLAKDEELARQLQNDELGAIDDEYVRFHRMQAQGTMVARAAARRWQRAVQKLAERGTISSPSRARRQTLPERLLLGLTLEALREDRAGRPSAADGYQNRELIQRDETQDGCTVCERHQRRGSMGVGRATVFVSLWLGTELDSRLSALERYLERHGLDAASTFFWICDFSMRQGAGLDEDLESLSDVIGAIGHTVLLMEPWHAPKPLERVWCVYEVFETHQRGARLTVSMGAAAAADFEVELVNNFESIAGKMACVDMRKASAYNPEDKTRIMAQVNESVGVSALNAVVIELLRDALVTEAHASLLRVRHEHDRLRLMLSVAQLLQGQGRLEEAAPLHVDALSVARMLHGDAHADTLVAITTLGRHHHLQGEVDQAEALYREALATRKATLGETHADTLTSLTNLGLLLQSRGRLNEAEPLLRTALTARRETLGSRDMQTLNAINNLGHVLKQLGWLDEAETLYREALGKRRATLGERHPNTLISMNNLAQVLVSSGDEAEARALFEQAATIAREVLGAEHPHTQIYERNCHWTREGRLFATLGSSRRLRSMHKSLSSLLSVSVSRSRSPAPLALQRKRSHTTEL